MNVHVGNVPVNASDKQVTEFLRGPLEHCDIKFFNVQKLSFKSFAFVTVPTFEDGVRFLFLYGTDAQRKTPLRRLFWDGKLVRCSQAHTGPSDFMVQALKSDATKALAQTSKTAQKDRGPKGTSRFKIQALRCGVWDYVEEGATDAGRLAFISHYHEASVGTVTFGRREFIVLLGPQGSDQVRLDFNYRDCRNIIVGTAANPAISFEVKFPPKIYKLKTGDLLSAALQAMALVGRPRLGNFKKDRILCINEKHSQVVGSCFVYRVQLQDSRDLKDIHARLSRCASRECTVVPMDVRLRQNFEYMDSSHTWLAHELTDTSRYGKKSYTLLYQIHRLALNGRLTPYKTIGLLPKISDLHLKYGLEATLYALRRFYHEMPFPGPEVTPSECSLAALQDILEALVEEYDVSAPDNVYELTKRYEHINLVHKVVVTPTRIHLEGPDPEPTNRVLRRYAQHSDHFLRVIFQDEDGSSVRHDPRATQSRVYQERFKGILDGTIPFLMAGRSFGFLGFSHSSLRNQSCWFMAPFVSFGELMMPSMILKRLGDFSHFRSPAKCAARIGQNFTDTNATVDVAQSAVRYLPVVERNGRDFSDGVGTISSDLLQRIWRVYGQKRLLKPTVLQIRFQGAKGMVSLDSRLRGQQLCLRSNMLKFETQATWNVEICGAGFRPLPMVLNRQFIKIFEDIGISTDVFLRLQQTAVDKLNRITANTLNAADFLERSDCPKATGLPELIRDLSDIGLSYHQDPFLASIVDLAVISKLRDIKYRGRIPVEMGTTLYGIMDETSVLQEGEIYVVREEAPKGGQQVLVQDRVVVTRSPAMHPGDIQVARAVDVPLDSPLKRLSNAVVFSSHGARDLPSQLSGGDLDGDLYNVIWDPTLIPAAHMIQQAADYPRVPAMELDREVTPKDMSDFFVRFMESDQLGHICNLHMQFADRARTGTRDPQCIHLAAMASTAVDFSKTGVPVNMDQLPRLRDNAKPDFMASSPRFFVSNDGTIGIDDDSTGNHIDYADDDDALADLDAPCRPIAYYPSPKALGHLYRAIDERQFLTRMHHQHHESAAANGAGQIDMLHKLLRYLQRWADDFGQKYEHQIDVAYSIMGSFTTSIDTLAHSFEPSPDQPLTELELLSGNILGRQGGVQGKPLRELSAAVRSRMGPVAEYARLRIRHGDRHESATAEATSTAGTTIEGDLEDLFETYSDRDGEGFPRALACFLVAVEAGDRATAEEAARASRGYTASPLDMHWRSFAYLAAGVVLQELRRWQIGTFGQFSLPRIWAEDLMA